jgi:hypothetical protein
MSLSILRIASSAIVGCLTTRDLGSDIKRAAGGDVDDLTPANVSYDKVSGAWGELAVHHSSVPLAVKEHGRLRAVQGEDRGGAFAGERPDGVDVYVQTRRVGREESSYPHR